MAMSMRGWKLVASCSAACALSLCAIGCGESDDDSRQTGSRDSGAQLDASNVPDASDAGDAGDVSDGAVDSSIGNGPLIYATISGDHEVLVIDEQSLTVLSHIPVGEGPAILLATPNSEKLYTANWADNSVSAIERATETVTNIAMTGRPYVIALAPAGDFLYVGVNPTGIAVVDTESDAIVRTIPTDALAASLIVSPDGETLYVATIDLLGPGTLRAISTDTGEVVHEAIEVGMAPAWITIGPDGAKVFTLNFLSDDVSVVDTETFEIVATVSTGAGSQAIIGNITPDGSTLYVTNHGTGELMAIDTTSYQVTQTVTLDSRPVGVQFNAAGTRVYITDFGPESLNAAPDLAYLLSGRLSATNPGQVSVYDIESGELIGEKVSTGPGATSVIVYEP